MTDQNFDLQDFKVGDLVKTSRDLCSMPSISPIESVLDTMKAENITAVAIFEFIDHAEDQPRSNNCKLISIVSIIDILSYVIDHGPAGLGRDISHAIDPQANSDNLFVYADQPLLEVLRHMITCGLHRVVVSASDINQSKLLTQTDIVRFFYDDNLWIPELQDVLDAPVGCIASDGIVDIDCNCSMHTAIQLLVDLVAAPITDDGAIVAVISVSDLKGTESTLLGMAKSQTVLQFVTERAARDNIEVSLPLMVEPQDTTRNAIRTMLKARVHRLWIAANDTFSTGAVLSYTDILRSVSDAIEQGAASSSSSK